MSDKEMDPTDSITAEDYINQQLNLEKKARELLPYDIKQCTYAFGPIRQDLYSCLTCLKKSGIRSAVCYACSIQCHTSHELVELFTKRDFNCDCGTDRMKCNGPCIVRYPKLKDIDTKNYQCDIANINNKYNQNFNGLFCDCEKPYNPMLNSNMFQCNFGVVCDEDWYHEECIMGLRPGIYNRNPNFKNNTPGNRLDELDEPGLDAESDDINKGNSDSTNAVSIDSTADSTNALTTDSTTDSVDDETDIIPLPGFPKLKDFETIICWKCVEKFRSEFEKLVGLLSLDIVEYVKADNLDDRLLKIKQHNGSEPLTKRVKRQLPITLFLKKNFKDELKKVVNESKDLKLVNFLKKFPFLYSDDPIYKQLEDSDDDNSSVFELGLKQLNSLPSDQAINGIKAYDKIKSKLTEFLKPFAEQNKIVTEEEVKNFFQNKMKEN